MQNEVSNTNANANKQAKESSRSVCLFWLVVGGFLLLEGMSAILHLAGIITKTDVGYAEAGFLAFVGATIVWYAVSP